MQQEKLLNKLDQIGLIDGASTEVTPLTGGVSCQILLLDDGKKRFVVKSALQKLKVEEDWFADVRRNKSEHQYLSYVSNFLPDAVPRVIYADDKLNFFCMEMLENNIFNWKKELLSGIIEEEYAVKVGTILGRIHSQSLNDEKAREQFDTLENFMQLRIEPYLLFTGSRHPDLDSYFVREAERLQKQSICLVHGDFSPKNIMVGTDRVVILDCEVAWYGDPIFDVAFLLNHFMLKALNAPVKAQEILEKLAIASLDSYKTTAEILIDSEFESRLVNLLLMLMLARVDGKSPVEYLSEAQQELVRGFVYDQLPKAPKTFLELKENWLKTIKTYKDED